MNKLISEVSKPDDSDSQLHEKIISEMVSDLKEDIQIRNIEGSLLQFGIENLIIQLMIMKH